MRTIPFFRATTPLTPAERLAKRRLVVQDTLALLGIFAVTCVLAVLTYLLFRSYSQHQSDAAARWKRRGESDLAAGNPQRAVFDLRAALGFAPDDRTTQIELAGALAKAGRLQEATAYFNTLWESEPGNGNINLQLARLAARQQQTPLALERYQNAIYGVWEGDGTVRRRQVRLELIHYLIEQDRFSEARNELLIAAGNDNTTPALLEVAGLFEAAHAPADALHLYHQVADRLPANLQALQGAGQTAFALGHDKTARSYLEKATNASSAAHPLINRLLVESNLRTANAVLAAYPSQELPQRERLRRVVGAHAAAQKRFLSCSASVDTGDGQNTANAATADQGGTGQSGAGQSAAGQSGTGQTDASQNNAGDSSVTPPARSPSGIGALADAIAARARGLKPSDPPAPAKPNARDEMNALGARWQTAHSNLTTAELDGNPELEQAAMQLVYDTEQITEHACGEPTGLDAALLRIAASPDAVEQ